MSGVLNPKLQHIKRRKVKEIFESIRNGDRGYEVCPNTPDLSLDVGDVITFQEIDHDGTLTGRAFTKKVLYKEPLSELQFMLRAEAGDEGIINHDYAILGLAEARYRTLRSIYEYALTFHLAVDVKEGELWEFVEGPHCSPPLTSPDLLELGVLNGLRLERWPPGRYSIILMVRITDAELNRPIKLDVIDLMVLTLVHDGTPERKYGGLMFEELDPLAILDGRTININGVSVDPMTPPEVDALLKDQEDLITQQYECYYNETFGTISGDTSDDD